MYSSQCTAPALRAHNRLKQKKGKYAMLCCFLFIKNKKAYNKMLEELLMCFLLVLAAGIGIPSVVWLCANPESEKDD